MKYSMMWFFTMLISNRVVSRGRINSCISKADVAAKDLVRRYCLR